MTAANGAEAIAVATAYPDEIHLLLTDVVMPKMLGKEVAERVRQIKPNIQVLYMSGYAQPVLASQGRLDPEVHLIDKPFSATSIIERAGQILNGRFDGFHTSRTGRTNPSTATTPSDSIDTPAVAPGER
jgi:CheY-like chemotaxis protein